MKKLEKNGKKEITETIVMTNLYLENKKVFKREIFLTGEYIRHFNPDDIKNPFHKIYRRKKQDTLEVINFSKNSKRILDVGGGMGRLSLDIKQSSQHDVFLTDISIEMLIIAKKDVGKFNNMEVINADAHQLPFSDNSFDFVVGLDLFCHLKMPEKALHEFHRVLKRHGVLILDSTNSNPLWALFYPRYLGKNPMNWLRIIKFRGVFPGWQTIVHHYPKKKFFSLLHKVGFKTIKCLHYGPVICPKWHLAVSKKI